MRSCVIRIEPGNQGGATARAALLLALFGMGLAVGAGCRRETPPAALRSVRLEALLPQHPAWAQVKSLERTIAQFASAPAQAAGLQYATSPLPPPFTPPVALPANLGAERDRRIQEDARRYIRQLEDSL